MPFIAVVKSSATHVLKYQVFDLSADALTHVIEHGGFVAPYPTPPLSDYIPDKDAKTLTLDQARIDARADKATEMIDMKNRKSAARAHNDNKPVMWGDLRQILIDIGAI